MEVTVPAGLQAGDTLTVLSIDGHHTFDMLIPPGTAPGSVIRVEVEYRRVEVEVPDGVETGSAFRVQSPWEAFFEVDCPPGCSPGDMIVVDLPVWIPMPMPAATATAKSEDSQSTSTAGRRVQVMRSNGSWSPATVVAYDELSATYTVRLDNGALKHLVEESDIQAVGYTPPKAGMHYEGRHVQVCVDQAKGWEDASIRSFDVCERTYTVELFRGGIDGGTRSGVAASDIRVRQRV